MSYNSRHLPYNPHAANQNQRSHPPSADLNRGRSSIQPHHSSSTTQIYAPMSSADRASALYAQARSSDVRASTSNGYAYSRQSGQPHISNAPLSIDVLAYASRLDRYAQDRNLSRLPNPSPQHYAHYPHSGARNSSTVTPIYSETPASTSPGNYHHPRPESRGPSTVREGIDSRSPGTYPAPNISRSIQGRDQIQHPPTRPAQTYEHSNVPAGPHGNTTTQQFLQPYSHVAGPGSGQNNHVRQTPRSRSGPSPLVPTQSWNRPGPASNPATEAPQHAENISKQIAPNTKPQDSRVDRGSISTAKVQNDAPKLPVAAPKHVPAKDEQYMPENMRLSALTNEKQQDGPSQTLLAKFNFHRSDPEHPRQIDSQSPKTINPSQVFNHMEFERRQAEIEAAKKAEAEANRSQMELEMKQMIDKMRDYKAKDPALFSHIWDQVKKVSCRLITSLQLLFLYMSLKVVSIPS